MIAYPLIDAASAEGVPTLEMNHTKRGLLTVESHWVDEDF